jgi:TPR repeat protein
MAGSACLLAGDLALRHTEPAKAVRMYQRACELSMQTTGCDDLAKLYFSGTGISRDPARGRAILVEACSAGSPAACHSLGARHRDGDGVPKQPAEAMRLFETACTIGFGKACLDEAALLRAEHSGLTPDPKRAEELRVRGCEMEPAMCPPAG